MINLTIQFLKRITKLTIKHQGGEGGLREVTKKDELLEKFQTAFDAILHL